MSKTKRKSKLYRERQTVIQLEKLEARQLLATVTGGGEEVGSDISYQGNVYDQVLMQGAAVSVEADPGQIVRVSWIDGNGDITQGEFSGSGTFTVSLDDFVEPAEPENYNQPGVEYASGHASITIEGSNSSSNVSVFTVGPTTSHNFGALDTGVDLDGVADIARITIVADPSQPGGSTFGGIRTANAMYSDDTGVVGIAADGVQVQTVVIIGDIDASNSGIPSLLFGDNSQFGTVQVAGGDLAQSNGEAINDGGFQTVSFIDGMTSDGVLQPASTFLGAFSSGEQRITALDTSTEINIEGMSQAELDTTFGGKTFTEDLTIVGDLEQYQRISAGEFQKSITFDGVYAGSITVGTVGGDITFMGTESGRTISSNITAGSLEGSLIFGSDTSAVNYSGTLRTSSMAAEAIQVFGDFTGTVTTDGDNDGSFDVGEGSIGDISVSGDFSGNVVGILGIGNITVGGNLTSEGGAVFYTSSNDTPDSTSVGAIGTLTVMGDVDQDDGDMLINIANNGSFGAITLMGGGTDVGLISIGGSLVGGSNGDISITGSYTVDVHGIDVNAGSLGHIRITGIAGTGVDGDENEESTLTLGNVEAGSSIGNVSISGSDRLSLNDITTKNAGMLDFSANKSIDADGAVTASNQLGAITFTGSTSINADITSAWMGPVMIDGNVTFADGMGLVSGDRGDAGDKAAASTGRLTSFEVTGNTTFNSTSGANIELATGEDFTFGGTVTGTASGTEIVASSLEDFSFSGALGSGQVLVENLTVRATPGDGDKVAKDGSKATDGTNLSDYSIGNISVETTNTIGIPGASLFAGNNVFHALGAIGDISLIGGGSPNAQTPLFSTDTDSLLLIVGDTTGDPTSAPTIDFDGDGTNDTFADIIKSTVSIGNVSINVGPDASNYNSFYGAGDPDATAEARFTGMNILSGVYASSADQLNAVNDRFVDVADLRANYDAAKETRDNLLGDNDPDELLADVTEAKTALGTTSVPDDPDTAVVDESEEATGTYVALEAAEAAVAEAQKAHAEVRDALVAGTDASVEIARLGAALGQPTVVDDPNTEANEAQMATKAWLDLETARGLLDEAETARDLLYSSQVAAVGDANQDAAATIDAVDASRYAQLKFAIDDLATKMDSYDASIAARAATTAARDTAQDAADSGVTDDADHRAVVSAEAISNHYLDGENRVAEGKTAYVRVAGDMAETATLIAEAPKTWNDVTDKDTEGYQSYNAFDGLDNNDSRIEWRKLDDDDARLAAGRAAWIADFITPDMGFIIPLDNGGDPEVTFTSAETKAETSRTGGAAFAARTAAENAAGAAYDELNKVDPADQIVQGGIAVGINAGRDLESVADDTARLAAINVVINELNTAVGDINIMIAAELILVSAARDALGAPGDVGDTAYGRLAQAEATLAMAKTAATGPDSDYAGEVRDFAKATDTFNKAQDAYDQAVADGTGPTTQEDVTEALVAITAAEKIRVTAQADVDTAKADLATAEDALPAGLAAALTTYDEAREALNAVGAGSLSADEILMANDADLEGTIGNVNIQNMTTLVTTNAVADITDPDDLAISIESASGIVGATSVGSLDASKAGMIIGGEDSTLDEDELLVYIV